MFVSSSPHSLLASRLYHLRIRRVFQSPSFPHHTIVELGVRGDDVVDLDIDSGALAKVWHSLVPLTYSADEAIATTPY